MHEPTVMREEVIATLNGLRTVRGQHDDGQAGLVKSATAEFADSEARLTLQREFDLTHKLQHPNLVHTLKLESQGPRTAILRKDPGGQTLRERLQGGRLSIRQALDIAIGIAQGLSELHRQDIVHRGLRPECVLVTEAGRACIFDFGDATRLTRQQVALIAVDVKNIDWLYLSPEQTGRTSRSVDFRTDFYSLGIMLYEMLSGAVPFTSDRPLDLLHEHLAVKPPNLSRANPDIPQVVGDLVAHLLEKDPDDRYRGAVGLVRDLERILDRIIRGLDPDSIELSSLGVSARFQIPDRLYGRDTEYSELEAAFHSACKGQPRLAMVRGASGIGKTSLVNALRPLVNASGGIMATGKFDQLDRGAAFQAIPAAFHDLGQQFLTLEQDRIEALRAELFEALGDNLGVLADLAPQLDILIGRVNRTVRLEAGAERNRMNEVVLRFLETIATAQRPLVLVLDDLQWADSATLDFLEAIAAGQTRAHVLLVGAYRDNEVDATHPLQRMLARLAGANIPVVDIELEALPGEAVAAMVADALGRSVEDAAPLSKLCMERTGSNPFYLRLFLNSLYEDELLRLDVDSNAWSWDMEELADRQLTENMAELALEKLKGLDEESRQLLGLMALVGTEGDVALLTDVRQGRNPQLKLREMADRELIILSEHAVNVFWKWSHDRIQEAAYHFIDESEQIDAQQRIGEILERRWERQDRRVTLFAVLRHRNAVALHNSAVSKKLAELNAQGADLAMYAVGYEAALGYYTTGIRLLGAQQWRTEPELAFRLHIGAADAARLATRFEDMYHWLQAIDRSQISDQDSVRAALLEILYLSHVGKNMEAVRIAREAFATLGWKLPQKPSLPRVMAGLIRTRWQLRKLSPEQLCALPEMKDETSISMMKLLSESLSAAYFADPLVMALIIQKAIQLTARHGTTPYGAHMIVAYGMVFSSVLKKPRTGMLLADAGVELAERYGQEAFPGRVRFNRDALVATATQPLRKIDPSLERAYVSGMEAGDLGFATGALYFLDMHRLFSGTPLELLEPALKASQEKMERHAQLRNLNAAVAQRQFVHDVMHGPEGNGAFSGPHIQGDEHLRKIDLMGSAWTLIFRSMSRYHLGDTQGARDDHLEAEKLLDAVVGQALVPVYHAYGVLIAAHLDKADSATIKRAGKSLKQLSWFARYNPEEYTSWLLLAQAAFALLQGKPAEAREKAEACREAARDQGLPLLVGLASDVGARCCDIENDKQGAAAWREEATQAFKLWGAPYLAQAELSPGTTDGKPVSGVDADLETIVSAAEAISQEFQLDNLLDRLIRVTMQNAGADRGLLLRMEGNQPVPEAEGVLRAGGEIDVRALDKHAQPAIARSAVRLVARTGEALISQCAMNDERLSGDESVAQHGIRSLLCQPLINQGKLQGVLYLENSQVDGAFTPERFRLLSLLSSQAASALEKARLYESQARLINAQRKFVPDQFITTLGHKDLFEVELGEGTLRDVDILFTDIRGFTSIVERMSPAEAMEFINDYLSHMEPAVLEHGGFVDKYIGDAILAMFDVDKGSAGVRAGIAMAAAERQDNVRRTKLGLAPIHTGIGVNTDSVMMGIVGGATSLRATIIGDAVNLASRLESLTKRYRTSMLISENTVQKMAPDLGITLRPLEWLQVAGKSQPTLVYEVLDALGQTGRQRRIDSLPRYMAAHEAFRQADLTLALEGFEEVVSVDTSDHSALIMLQTTRRLLELGETCDSPPVTRLEKK